MQDHAHSISILKLWRKVEEIIQKY